MMQNYETFHLFVPIGKWHEWCHTEEEDVVLKSILEHIRLLGGRHLSEKSSKHVLAIWMLCTTDRAKAISLSALDKLLLLKRVKGEAKAICVGHYEEFVKTLPRNADEFKEKFPRTYGFALDGATPGACPFTSTDIIHVSSSMRCRCDRNIQGYRAMPRSRSMIPYPPPDAGGMPSALTD